MFQRRRGAYEPVRTSEDSDNSDNSDNDDEDVKKPAVTGANTSGPTVVNPTAIAQTKPTVGVKPHKSQKGCHLEMLVQTLTMIGAVISVGNISLSLKVVTDGMIPSVTVQAWLILTGLTAWWDLVVFMMMIMLMWATFRTKNTLQSGQIEAYPDDWYATYMEATGTTALISCLTFTLIITYYYRFGGEEPWNPSVYNVRDWEKPQQWVGAHYMNISMRIVLLLRVYYRAYQFISEPTVIFPASKTEGTDKSQ